MKNFEERLKAVENALDAFYGKVKETKKSEYPIVSLVDNYNHQAVNPNGIYETDRAIVDGERDYCESEGKDWNDWCEVKQFLKEYEMDKFSLTNIEKYLSERHPNVLEELKDINLI